MKKKAAAPKPPVTMTMHFREPLVLEKFIQFCKSKGLHGTMKYNNLHDGSDRVTVTVTGFKNKTARTAFTSLGATTSLSR
jgi:hypothetical protein